MQYESLPHAFQGPSAKRIGGDASGFISGVGILADRNAINAVPVSSVHQDVGARGVLRCRGCPSAIRAAFRFALRLALSPARGVDDACRDTAGLADTGLVRRSYPFGRCGVIWIVLQRGLEIVERMSRSACAAGQFRMSGTPNTTTPGMLCRFGSSGVGGALAVALVRSNTTRRSAAIT